MNKDTLLAAGKNWPSPAKINLFLHITGRRANGYHELQTLFQMLDFGDTLDFEISDNGSIQLVTPMPGVADKDNLIIKAARMLLAHKKSSGKHTPGCKIRIDKRLPMGGGIGGGSSNAATTLVALNLLWDINLEIDILAQLGLQLGADVPVFVRGLSAYAEGVGETLTAAEIPAKTYLVVNPGVQVSTAEIFTSPQLPRNTAPIEMENWEFSSTKNDCEALVCEKYPVIAKSLQWLLQYAPSRMTGTGASLFGVFDSQNQARQALTQLPDNCIGFIANGCNQSPLLARLKTAKQQLSVAKN